MHDLRHDPYPNAPAPHGALFDDAPTGRMYLVASFDHSKETISGGNGALFNPDLRTADQRTAHELGILHERATTHATAIEHIGKSIGNLSEAITLLTDELAHERAEKFDLRRRIATIEAKLDALNAKGHGNG
jgi:hypothetical protein